MSGIIRSSEWQRPDPQLVRQFAEFPVAVIGDSMERLDIIDGGISQSGPAPVASARRCPSTPPPATTLQSSRRSR